MTGASGEVNIEKKIFYNCELESYSLIGCEKKNVTFSAHRDEWLFSILGIMLPPLTKL